MNILVVDDYASIVLALSIVLKSYGHTVRTAVNGEKALVDLAAYACDLMVTDVQMPIMDGIKLTEAAKHRFPALFIIVISSHPEHGIAALDAGANVFIAKPFDIRDFMHVVDDVSSAPRE